MASLCKLSKSWINTLCLNFSSSDTFNLFIPFQHRFFTWCCHGNSYLSWSSRISKHSLQRKYRCTLDRWLLLVGNVLGGALVSLRPCKWLLSTSTTDLTFYLIVSLGYWLMTRRWDFQVILHVDSFQRKLRAGEIST